MTWDGVLRLSGQSLTDLAVEYGGRVVAGGGRAPLRITSIERAGERDLAPVFGRRFLSVAARAASRGALLLVDASLVAEVSGAPAVWSHPHASWAMARLLERVPVVDAPAAIGNGCLIAPSAVLGPRVVVGDRVTIGAGTVIGHPGFGWARGPTGESRAVPQLGGVVIEDDVAIGPLSTVDAGTLGPTRIRRGAKLDAHVHVGHNVEIGEDTFVAAQCGFAGSVRGGGGVQIGGQTGIADHVVIGDGARIGAKSGVIGDVPPGAVVAGYPAVPRVRWLRGLANLYRRSGEQGENRHHDRD